MERGGVGELGLLVFVLVKIHGEVMRRGFCSISSIQTSATAKPNVWQ